MKFDPSTLVITVERAKRSSPSGDIAQVQVSFVLSVCGGFRRSIFGRHLIGGGFDGGTGGCTSLHQSRHQGSARCERKDTSKCIAIRSQSFRFDVVINRFQRV